MEYDSLILLFGQGGLIMGKRKQTVFKSLRGEAVYSGDSQIH